VVLGTGTFPCLVRQLNQKQKEDPMTTGAMFLLAVGTLILASVIYEGLIKG